MSCYTLRYVTNTSQPSFPAFTLLVFYSNAFSHVHDPGLQVSKSYLLRYGSCTGVREYGSMADLCQVAEAMAVMALSLSPASGRLSYLDKINRVRQHAKLFRIFK